MKKRINYKNAPKEISEAIMLANKIDDFLPDPEKLIFKDESVKITISLSKDSIDFFKNKAKKIDVSYQKMIRRVLDLYVSHYRK